MTILFYAGLFLASVIITLAGCHLFTNGIEWLGKRLNISEGAVGSVFAAVGTTLPETSIPIIAIFFGAGREQAEVGLGAILGAPFMLSTLVLPILAFLLLLYARIGKRTATFKLNYGDVRVDIIFFLIAYVLALTCAFSPSRLFHAVVAIALIGLYVYYMKLKFSAEDEESEGGGALEPLLFARRSPRPLLSRDRGARYSRTVGAGRRSAPVRDCGEFHFNGNASLAADPRITDRALGYRVAGNVQ